MLGVRNGFRSGLVGTVRVSKVGKVLGNRMSYGLYMKVLMRMEVQGCVCAYPCIIVSAKIGILLTK